MGAVNIKRTTSILFFLRVLKMLVSLVTVTLTAQYFGVSVEKDAWLLVSALLTSILMLLWGPINETFRAKFIFIKEREGEKQALYSASSLVSGIVIITILLISILMLFAKKITIITAQDLGNQGIVYFLYIFIFLLPTLLIEEINNISISILNSYNIFYIPEIVGAITSILYIGVLIISAPYIGIYSVVIGQYVSILSLLIVLYIYLRKLKLFKIKWFFKPDFRLIKPFLIYALPFFFPYSIGQINYFSERWIATLLGVGNLSILDFARRFTVILQSVISSVLTTLMVPLLAKAHVANDNNVFQLHVKEHIETVYAILLLAIPLLFGVAYPLCDFLFHRGSVTEADIKLISNISRGYAVAFLGVILYILFGNILLSSEQGKRYALWGVICQIVVIIINFSLVSTFGLFIFPISLGVVHLIAGVIMWINGRAWSKDLFIIVLRNNAIILFNSVIIYFVSTTLLPKNTWVNILLSSFLILILTFIFLPFIGINPLMILKKIENKILERHS